MYKVIQRQLNDEERQFIREKYREHRKMQWPKIGMWLAWVVSIVVFPITINNIAENPDLPSLLDKISWVLAFISSFIFFGHPILLLEYLFQRFGYYSRALKQCEKNGQIKIEHIKTDTVMELKEYEDEGFHYMFQVDENLIWSTSGQNLYMEPSMPNSNFQVTTFLNKRFPVWTEFTYHGQKLAPNFFFEAKRKWDLWKSYDIPTEGVFEGKLENLEEIIKSGYIERIIPKER